MARTGYIKEIRSHVGSMLLQMPSVAVRLKDNSGKILFVCDRETGLWSLPGGAIEPCELPAFAAAREMEEETGLKVKPLRVFAVLGGPEFVVEYPNGDRTSYVAVIFDSKLIGGEPIPDGDEISEIRYFSREEISEVAVQLWVTHSVDILFTESSETIFVDSKE